MASKVRCLPFAFRQRRMRSAGYFPDFIRATLPPIDQEVI